MSPQIDFTVEWEGLSPDERPSIALGLPIDSKLNEAVDVQGIGTVTVLGESTGDRHGGLWNAMLEATLSFGAAVASSMVASWLYDRIKQGHATTLIIKKRRIVIEQESSRLLIEEVVEEYRGENR